jgi:hypothetical protein
MLEPTGIAVGASDELFMESKTACGGVPCAAAESDQGWQAV